MNSLCKYLLQSSDLVKKRKNNRRYSYQLFGSLALLLSSLGYWSQPAQAEGSREIVVGGGARPLTEWRTDLTSGVTRRTVLQVYAQAGEVINVGSSAIGVAASSGGTFGNALVFAPGANVDTATPVRDCRIDQPGSGKITSRNQEVQGPLPKLGGYTPCTYSPTTSGIYQVVFYGPNGKSATGDGSPTRSINDAPGNFDSTQRSGVALWDITVRSSLISTTDLNGRVFTNYLAILTGTNGTTAKVNSNLYIQTKDGYQYNVKTNNLDPNGFIFFSNNRGFLDTATNKAIYRSISTPSNVLPAGVAFQPPDNPDTAIDHTNKIFFNQPDPLAIAAVSGFSTSPIIPAAATTLTFTGIEGTAGQTGTSPLQGTFSFFNPNVNTGSYAIVLNFGGSIPSRTMVGTAVPGNNQVVWDGKDGQGNAVPPSTVAYNAQVTIYAGEAHFPMLDAEGSDGLIIQRTSPATGPNPTTVYYDDRRADGTPLGTTGGPPNPISLLTGGDSSLGNIHRFGNNTSTGFGDQKGIDTWTYYPSTQTALQGGIIVLQADLAINKTDGLTTIQAGQPITYTITVTNNGPSNVTGAQVLDTVPTEVIGVTWTCAITTGVGACGATSGTGNNMSTTVNLNNGAVATYTVQGTVVSTGSGTLTNTAKVLRPNDVTDPTDPSRTGAGNNTSTDTTTIVPVYNISGILYQDTDGGDDFDAGEATLPANITVKLLDSTGTNTIATTTTNASGQYTFSGVVNGTYRIQVDTTDADIPTGFTLGTPNNLSVTVSGSAITGQNFGFDAPVGSSCSIGGGTPDGAIAPYLSAEVRSDTITSRNVVDTLDDSWRTAANAPTSGTIQPWFGTVSSPGTLASFTYRDPSTAANISTTVELVDVAISGADNCAGQTSTSAAQLDNNIALQDTAPRPASLYNTANQPLFWNQTGAGTNSKRAAIKFTFAQPVKSFGAWFGDLETRTIGATPAILRLLDASGNRIGSDIVIQPTDIYENSTTSTPVDQNSCGSIAPGIDRGCGNRATRWIGFVDSSATARVKQVLVIVGDDDQGDNGDTERISFIGANVIPSSPNVLLVKRITAVNGSTTTNGGDNLASYINEAANPYDDNTIEPSLAPNPPTYPTPDTDKWLNPSTFLLGGINGGAVQPRDTLEYTIYFLSTGAQDAKNVRFCDRVPDNTTFLSTAFGSSPDRGIVVNQGGTITNLTNVPDTDAGQYFAPGVDPATIYPGINCGGANTNGAVVVNLGDLPFATGQGVPAQSYGFVRFRGTVK